jgi:hypothetical protein
VSESLEKRGETALAPLPKEEVSARINAIALSNESYWQRVRQIVVWQTGEYFKNDFLYSTVAAIFMGLLALIWHGGVDTTALYFGIVGFLVVFAARFGQHVVITPKLIDNVTRNALNEGEQRYTELTKHKLVFEVRQQGCRVFFERSACRSADDHCQSRVAF